MFFPPAILLQILMWDVTVVPLLALPQITHYIMDGFIWKIKQEEFKWSNEI
ncbi:hypothetical protein [Chitinophaga tropicalis]|uniref:Uncharacterized protein n=1 Tax=Chitinophaga tropicalis TaxID=2683588 RepID=A0A7K1U9L2_9BACT|nr:hypothetical protein [Chitinophaga tropicalis]MVT11033.1 hypothetical protein [Chitinophaga tropicalis]